ncbi:MAG: cyclic pyranopterin monophosphate synthase MoaC [Bacteroidetes bacterium]|nr:cyclic pyranopterin monophosphate synthase MoaC [Bacteroidota bacterium]
MSDFSHINEDGQPHMVDVSEKQPTQRTAVAQCQVELGAELLGKLNNDELHLAKGPVFQTAIIAGIMAAKHTAQLIPMCHPLPVEHVHITIKPVSETAILIEAQVNVQGKTGVEMEALTATSIAALTVYDMCKAVNKAIVIKENKLVKKTGGKSDFKAQ